MNTQGSIDGNRLQELFESLGGDAEFLMELVAEFEKDTPIQFKSLHAALAAGDADTFRRAAHSLKSNSANFGASALSLMCKEMEDLGKAGDLSAVAAKVSAAEIEYRDVQAALRIAVQEY